MYHRSIALFLIATANIHKFRIESNMGQASTDRPLHTYCPQAQKEPQGIHQVDVGTCSEGSEQGAEGTHRLTHCPHPPPPIPAGQPAPRDLGEDVPVTTPHGYSDASTRPPLSTNALVSFIVFISAENSILVSKKKIPPPKKTPQPNKQTNKKKKQTKNKKTYDLCTVFVWSFRCSSQKR